MVLLLSLGCVGKSVSEQASSHLVTFQNGLPIRGGGYISEIEELINQGIVEEYGREEFEAAILTHEIHGHIGAYTLIGTKMGLRAMELLNAPQKKMQIVSEAGGGKYPLGCMNDGILGATLCSAAFGTLAIEREKSNYAARFTYVGKTLRLKLKDEYRSQLEAKIDEAVSKYKKGGEFTQEYWEEVEKITWWIWPNWDRKIIFDIEWL
jgi:pyrimidine-specific ribonucleoside hydrolase